MASVRPELLAVVPGEQQRGPIVNRAASGSLLTGVLRMDRPLHHVHVSIRQWASKCLEVYKLSLLLAALCSVSHADVLNIPDL
jgi:hypothetical protein